VGVPHEHPLDATQRLLRTLQATRTVVELGRVVQAGGTVLRATGCARASASSAASSSRHRPTTARCWPRSSASPAPK
jgi:hypothetical protein